MSRGAAARREARERIATAIAELPPAQRAVITLRDVEGLTADEACDVLELTRATSASSSTAPIEGSRRARGVPGGEPEPSAAHLQEIVELVTDYLEGRFPIASGDASRITWPPATGGDLHRADARDDRRRRAHGRARASRPARATVTGRVSRLALAQLGRAPALESAQLAAMPAAVAGRPAHDPAGSSRAATLARPTRTHAAESVSTAYRNRPSPLRSSSRRPGCSLNCEARGGILERDIAVAPDRVARDGAVGEVGRERVAAVPAVTTAQQISLRPFPIERETGFASSAAQPVGGPRPPCPSRRRMPRSPRAYLPCRTRSRMESALQTADACPSPEPARLVHRILHDRVCAAVGDPRGGSRRA